LGVTTSHRKAMMRNLVTALLEHGEIKTTITRAKEMRKYFDKMIGLGKRSSLHARRQALSFIKSKEVVKRLFDEYGPLYEGRNGGYTRIFRLGQRLGDNAQMALIQMVDLKESEKGVQKSTPDAIAEIKSELQSKEIVPETAVEIDEGIEVAAEAPEDVAAVDEPAAISEEPKSKTAENLEPPKEADTKSE